ncbi:hypothetical protein MBM_07656 [Drepanopeziza brunnea f. sp. 'multigermtubi' MB_m1]|uniref:Flap structure-specific endonuclease n=1 Tax=Marssonina brunnea f. sp. multigermtubi (strain MB_m1) TaxID=1072389 RepID=K1XNA5_MARBU|nr:uncharacterized protein MBM_07656 [Drepanopeziza brunnea f. sp. 'multigermtubi' MB_m1]EKD13979.1 hypothetical protein MBM_07656 [Drepanopeziza brunnea f. sp. 'multigermtubi' MB_m1]
MGIPGIYEEIGRGERVCLSKLAIEKLVETGRPLRLAIDISIWQFQIQSGQGGSNPAIRTLYYRLIRLLSLSIQPLFVFDGPQRPQLKRNKRVGRGGASASDMAAKQLLKLFGFPCHNAPGEAEAECALLQRKGIVDAVLSEDVDTLMFGSGITLRDWSSEGARGSKAPTHVSLFDAKKTKEGSSGLDREGMILVALLSGGDYNTDGLPGIGIKVACQAARAGFGKELCGLSRSDEDGLATWRSKLTRELQTNENKVFKSKHKSMTIPDTFPSKEILGYYTHPVVSTAQKVEKLKSEIQWDGVVDVPGLREYVKEGFSWSNIGGARKFIRNLAPALLVHQLRIRADRRDSGYGDLILTQIQEMDYVRSICGQREHFDAGGMPELKVVFHPMDIVKLDLDKEYDDSADYSRDGLAPVNDEDQIEAYVSDEDASAATGKRAASQYDPKKPDKTWIPETLLKLSLPLKVEDYKAAELAKRMPKEPKVKAKKTAKPAGKKAATTSGGMQRGALEKYVRVSKGRDEFEDAMIQKPLGKTVIASQPVLPPVYLAPSLERISASQPPPAIASKIRPVARTAYSSTDAILRKAPPKPRARTKAPEPDKPKANTNPWYLASKCTTSSQTNPKITKSLGQIDKNRKPQATFKTPINIDSSPLASPSPSPPPPKLPAPTQTSLRKHVHSPSPPNSPPLHSDYESPLPSTVTISRGSKSRHRYHHRPDNILTPSKTRMRSLSRPSPRKKTSPSSKVAPPFLPNFDELKSLSPELVARKLSFSAPEERHCEGGEEGGVNLDLESQAGAVIDTNYDYDDDDDNDEFPDLEDLLSPPNTKSNYSPASSRLNNTSPSFTNSASQINTSSSSATGVIANTHSSFTSTSTSAPTSPSTSSATLATAQAQISSVAIISLESSSSSSPPQPRRSSPSTTTTQLQLAPKEQKNKQENATAKSKTGNKAAEGKQQTGKNPKKKFILLRESLAGSWDAVDERELEADLARRGGRKRRERVLRMSAVEVLDLTED